MHTSQSYLLLFIVKPKIKKTHFHYFFSLNTNSFKILFTVSLLYRKIIHLKNIIEKQHQKVYFTKCFNLTALYCNNALRMMPLECE